MHAHARLVFAVHTHAAHVHLGHAHVMHTHVIHAHAVHVKINSYMPRRYRHNSDTPTAAILLKLV